MCCDASWAKEDKEEDSGVQGPSHTHRAAVRFGPLTRVTPTYGCIRAADACMTDSLHLSKWLCVYVCVG